MSAAAVEEYTVRTRGAGSLRLVRLLCPRGHEVVSAPVDSRVGRALHAGDFSEEFCGYGRCGWSGLAGAAS